MAAKRTEYLRLNEEYDRLMEQAHALPHGSGEMVQLLSALNVFGPQVFAALREYHDAVEQLTEFYRTAAT